jgi:cellulose synthase operon protein C
VPLLGQLVTTVGKLADKYRAPRYARALVVAGHFGRVEQVPGLLELLRAALRLVDAAELENVLQFSLRALRRIGLRRETADLLVAAEEARTGTPVQILRGRLAIAGGLSYLGEYDRAKPIFEQAHATIDNTTLSPTSTNAKERLELVRATALAYAQAPLQQAIAGISQLSNVFKDISDVQSVNSHYCLSVLDFVESLVLGITSDDLALGEAGRRFVEDDEHLIRRRLHADLGGPA